jgi:integrase
MARKRSSEQRGEVYFVGASWKARYYDSAGKRRQVGGFREQTEALAFLERELRRVRRARLGHDVVTPEPLTLSELVDEYLVQHQAEPSTLATLRFRLGYATDAWGDLQVRRLTAREIRSWRARLPSGSRRGIHQALRQCLDYAVAVKLIDENPAKAVPNPETRGSEIVPFTDAELELVADEIDQRYRALPLFAAGTGLRPEEWIALERGDIDRRARVVHVRRTLYQGALKEYGKTERSRRRVPLSVKALEALEAAPQRIDTELVFAAPNGGHLNLHNWRRRVWIPALVAAGLYDCPRCARPMRRAGAVYRCERHRDEQTRPRRIYDLRHTFASNAIAAGVSLFPLARFMGTSVQMLDRVYGHLLPDAEAETRELLDAFDRRKAEQRYANEAGGQA